MADKVTFNDSRQALQYLQNKFGTANYNSWQVLRKPFWSFVKYPAAGAATFTFFSDAVGTNSTTKQTTNMPKAGSLGQQHFLIKSIATSIYIADFALNGTYTDDTYALYSDIVNGIFTAGYLEVIIGGRSYLQLPKPFLYAPPANGRPEVHFAGQKSLTLTEGTPNTVNAFITCPPHAELANRDQSMFIVDPNILVEAEQNFTVNIGFPTGALAVNATNVVNDSTNPLYIGVILDGLVFRPVQ